MILSTVLNCPPYSNLFCRHFHLFWFFNFLDLFCWHFHLFCFFNVIDVFYRPYLMFVLTFSNLLCRPFFCSCSTFAPYNKVTCVASVEVHREVVCEMGQKESTSHFTKSSSILHAGLFHQQFSNSFYAHLLRHFLWSTLQISGRR